MKQNNIQDRTIWRCLNLIRYAVIKPTSSFNWRQNRPCLARISSLLKPVWICTSRTSTLWGAPPHSTHRAQRAPRATEWRLSPDWPSSLPNFYHFPANISSPVSLKCLNAFNSLPVPGFYSQSLFHCCVLTSCSFKMRYPTNFIRKPNSCTKRKCDAYNGPHFALVLTRFSSPKHIKCSRQNDDLSGWDAIILKLV